MLELNEVEYCKVKVKYTADSDKVKEKYKKAISELKKLPVPGFRPNKATDQAIRNHFKAKIDAWVKQEMISESYEDILFETKIQPIGFPQTLDLKLDGNDFNCEFLFLKKPDFELKEVKGLEIPKPHQNITQNDYVEEMLQEIRTQNSNAVPYADGDFVQAGDTITMDYTVDDQVAEGELYKVGNNLLPEFDDNIIGMAPGESREFDVLNPTTNAKSHVKVLLHMGMKKTLCGLDDELAVKVGLKDLAELRKVVEGISSNRLKQHTDAQIADQIKKRLVDMHDFELPEWLTNMELQQVAQRMSIDLATASDQTKSDLITQAKNSVKFALILDSIRKNTPEADLSDEEILNIIKAKVANQVQDVDGFLQESQKNGKLLGFVAQVRNEVTLQYLIDNAKIVE